MILSMTKAEAKRLIISKGLHITLDQAKKIISANKKMSKGESLFDFQLKNILKVNFVREYIFHDTRKWRFDFAFPERMIAVEIEGATWANGRHNRGAGMEEDMVKYNEAARLGWRLFRFSTGMVKSGKAIAYFTSILNEV